MLAPAALVTPVGLAACALLVLALRPGHRLHQLLAAILIVRAGFIAANAWAESAAGVAEARAALSTAQWYVIPLPLLTLAIASTLRPARHDRALLALALLVTLGLLAAMAFAPGLYSSEIVRTTGGYFAVAEALVYVVAVMAAFADALLVVRAARVAADALGTAAARNAAGLGLAFALFPLYAAGSYITLLFVNEMNAGFALRTAASLGAAIVIVAHAPRLVAPFRPRGALLALAGVLVLLGALDPLVARGDIAIAGYPRALGMLRIAYALLVVGAVLRFGLADAGLSTRRRATFALQATFAGAIAAALVGVIALLLGANVVGLAAGVVLASVGGAAAWRPLDRPARWLSTRLLLAPDDPRAVAERARTYAAAVAASQGAGAEGEILLRDLRRDLDITQREHELLAEGLASREKGRYTRIEGLGSGATANVELALDEVAGKRVVVKRFKGLRDPAAVLREARALAAVKHPRVVPFLEVDRRDDEVYLVLAYAEGGSARQLLEKEGPLPPARAVGLTLDLLDGLDALHEQGVVHCDVKAENLLLDRDGRGLLGDFGSARFSAPDLVDATLTGSAAEGSLSTISPEALRSATPAPSRDVYAAGALLYRLLTGQHYVALAGATVFEARERITLEAPRLPHPKVPPSIEAVVLKALAKKPDARYQSAREMRDALASALARS